MPDRAAPTPPKDAPSETKPPGYWRRAAADAHRRANEAEAHAEARQEGIDALRVVGTEPGLLLVDCASWNTEKLGRAALTGPGDTE